MLAQHGSQSLPLPLAVKRSLAERVSCSWRTHHHRNVLDVLSISLVFIIFVNGTLGCNGNTGLQRNACAIEVLILFLRLLYYSMADSRMGAFFRSVQSCSCSYVCQQSQPFGTQRREQG
jgi:hypothetical protein